MTTKKSLAIYLALVVALAFAAVCGAQVINFAYADESEPTVITSADNVFEYAADNATKIVGFTLPSDVQGKFQVVIPDNATELGDRLFVEMSDLVAVTLPQGLTVIGDYAFAKTSLTSVSIPASVTRVGEHAFDGCVALANVSFAARSAKLTLGIYAFADCINLQIVNVPAQTTVKQSAFVGCSSLVWAYVGDDCDFDSAGVDTAVFFPTKNKTFFIVFSSASAYKATLDKSDQAFKDNNGDLATYSVKVNCYVEGEDSPRVYERLHGKSFNYVKDSNGYWHADMSYSALPVQNASYASTTWYFNRELTQKASYDNVNAKLLTEDAINLYCHETVLPPSVPTEPLSWVYSDDVSYDIADLTQMLTAFGCEHGLTASQMQAIDFSVKFANENGEAADTPAVLRDAGVYSLSLSLNPDYGVWAQTVSPTVTVNVNTRGFNTVLIIFLVLGVLTVALAVTTAVIRMRVQARGKKKQLSKEEVLEKYRAIGGETSIK